MLLRETMAVYYKSFITNSVGPEHEVSSSFTQEPAIDPYTETTKYTLHPQPITLTIHYNPIYALAFRVVSFLVHFSFILHM
jgi:hypothetical protein